MDIESSSSRQLARDPVMRRVIGCAIEVHRTLGPGLLESAYAHCLAYELAEQGIRYRQQIPIPIKYKRIEVARAYRIDMLVDERIILEIKSVERLTHVHQAQLLTYMRMTGIATGYLVNFNVYRLTEGIRRLVL
jgi:GxxExxY protein